jgi:hypothetical protein
MARTKKPIRVVLSKQGERGHWLASAPDYPDLRISGIGTRSPRMRISNMIKERFGDDAEIQFEVRLDADAKAVLDQHLEMEREYQRLTHTIPASRVATAEYLLGEQLTQLEVGELMGLSQGHLAVILKREATGEKLVKPTTQRRSR